MMMSPTSRTNKLNSLPNNMGSGYNQYLSLLIDVIK